MIFFTIVYISSLIYPCVHGYDEVECDLWARDHIFNTSERNYMNFTFNVVKFASFDQLNVSCTPGMFTNYHLNLFPLNEMLPGSSVKRVFQDHRGFVWFGTESGICRYDGYNLLIIKSDIEHPNLLTSGNILCIEQDKQKRIWFGKTLFSI